MPDHVGRGIPVKNEEMKSLWGFEALQRNVSIVDSTRISYFESREVQNFAQVLNYRIFELLYEDIT